MNVSGIGPDPMDHGRFPVDPWRLVETGYDPDDLGLTETLFTVGNGYLGMRGNPEEGRPTFVHGTFVNGYHETWPIRHAETTTFGRRQLGRPRQASRCRALPRQESRPRPGTANRTAGPVNALLDAPRVVPALMATEGTPVPADGR